MGSVVFTDTHSSLGLASATYDVEVNYSESYNASTRQTTVQITSVRIRKRNNTIEFPSAPMFGIIKINGTPVMSVSSSASYTCKIYDGSYNTAGIPTPSSYKITHDANTGAANMTITLDGVSGSSMSTYFCAYYYWYSPGSDDYKLIAGVPAGSSKTVALTTRASKLTVNPNGGTWASSTSSLTYTQGIGSTKIIDNPTRDNYIFNGWTLSGGGSISGTTFTFGSGDGILVANWVPVSRQLTIDPDGGSWEGNTSEQTITQQQGSTINLENPVRLGYNFLGWDLTGGGSLSGVTYTFGDSDGELTALWDPMATIHIHKNGAWALYLIYIRRAGAWVLHQSNIRKNGTWTKYY